MVSQLWANFGENEKRETRKAMVFQELKHCVINYIHNGCVSAVVAA